MFFSALTVLVVLHFVIFGNADIIIIPQNFTIEFDSSGHPYNNLTVMCTIPQQNDIRGVTFIQLRKYHQVEKQRTSIATLTSDENTGFRLTKETGLDGRRYNLSGLISAEKPLSSFLRVEFSDGSCADEGRFECSVHFHREGAQETEVLYHSANLTTKNLPGQVLLWQKPASDSFVVNQIVELHCSAQVGMPPAYYRWQYRHTGQDTENETDFQTVTFGVTTSEGPYPQGFCKYFRSATLWVRAELELNGVEIRCILVRGLTQYENSSASFIFKVKEAGCVPECWNSGVCVIDTCQCPENFTGSFCEQEVKVPCSNDCDDTSISSTLDLGNLYRLSLLLLLFLMLVIP